MQIKPAVASVVGPVALNHWGQVLMTPHAYGVVEVVDDEGIARQLGIRTLSLLGSGLDKGVISLEALESIATKAAAPGVRTILLFLPVGRVVYVVLRGGGIVYLKRRNVLSKLMDKEGGVSGEAQEGDTFLLASEGFSQILSQEEIRKLFDHLTPAEVGEKLTLILHEKQGGEGSAACIYQVASLVEGETFVHEFENAPSQISPHKRRLFGRALSLLRLVARRLKVCHFMLEIRRNPRKRTAAITAALGVIFIVSVAIGVVKQARRVQNQRIVRVLAEATHAFDEGVALMDLNPIKGRERLTQAKAALEPLVSSVSPRTSEGRNVMSLYQRVSEYLAQSLHSETVPLQLFYDVSLLKKGSTIGDMALGGPVLAIIDKTLGTVYQLDIASKKAQIVAGGESFKGAALIAIYGDTQYVLSDTGIHQVRLSDKTISPAIIKKDEEWGIIHDVISFGGNIYLLDTQKGRIWKYIATEKSFSTIREYLNPDTLPDFSHATNMSIDGSVWVGTTTGKIFKFTQGQEQTFLPSGVDPPLGENLVVYTSDELHNIYVLDSQNKRVVVLDKDGMYLAQYQWEDTVPITDIVASEETSKLLLLGAGKLYFIELK